MNKTKKSIKKPLRKRVLHIILPEIVWNKFEKWRIEFGFSSTSEGVRYLIRERT